MTNGITAAERPLPPLAGYFRQRRRDFFFRDIPKQARILEIGCGDGWVKTFLKENGWTNYTGMDLYPPADIVGDVRQWRQLGLAPASFDVIVAFEVVEHVSCFADCHALLKPGGRLLVTTPVPHMDWLLKFMENCGLNQKRTSPHDHLTKLSRVNLFSERRLKTVFGLSQWAVFVR